MYPLSVLFEVGSDTELAVLEANAGVADENLTDTMDLHAMHLGHLAGTRCYLRFRDTDTTVLAVDSIAVSHAEFGTGAEEIQGLSNPRNPRHFSNTCVSVTFMDKDRVSCA